MVETSDRGSVEVPPLQLMDSHFIYQAVNLKAPSASQQRPPAPNNSHQPGRSVTLNFYLARLRTRNHTCIVFATDQLKG